MRTIRKPFEPVFFFGYGSLIKAPGINGRGLRRIYRDKDLVPARLHGFKRGMNAHFKGRNFYGILPEKDSTVNGVIFPIATKQDYRTLLGNEGALKAYGRDQVYWTTRVTQNMEYLADFTLPKGWRVMTLVGNLDKTGWGQISPWYVDKCQGFARQWGKDFYEEFLATGGMTMEQWNQVEEERKKHGNRKQARNS